MTQDPWKRWRLPEIGVLVASLLVTLLAAEAVMRVGIHLNLGRLRDPSLYTHPFCDDDYHKLRYLWTAADNPLSGLHRPHPTLGWVPSHDPAHSQPVLASLDALWDAQPTVAIFGDSFMAGVPPSPPTARISSLLVDKLQPRRIVDFSVSGYGVDQVYLRFREMLETAGDHPPEVAVFGILLDDLDRVVETFREGPKPYFVASGEDLELRGVPILESSDAWLDQHPPRWRSFLLAMINRRLGDRREWEEHQRTVFEDECRRQEKETLNRELLTRLVDEARRHAIRPVFVIFYSERALSIGSWKEEFLKATLDHLDVEVLDTRELLTGTAANLQSGDYYYPPPNGHLNDAGNARVAAVITDLIAGSHADATVVPPAGPWQATVQFGRKSANDIPLLRRGWETDGELFSWSNANEAMVQLPGPPAGRRLLLTLDTLCALKTPQDERLLTIEVDRQIVHQIPLTEFPDCWQPAVFEAVLPDRLQLGRMVRVSLRLEGLLTPGEAGLDSPDDRRLGIAVRSIGLHAVEED